MVFYLKLALFLCRLTNTAPSFLLHPLDFVGSKEVTDLSFFPGMNIHAESKAALFKNIMETLGKYFEFVNMSTYANKVLEAGELQHQTP